MANDFSQYSSCLAVWRFESGALTADSKGNNTLTAVNGPTEDTTNYIEGNCCADLNRASNQYFEIPDANLPSDFPLKNNGTVRQGTFFIHLRMRNQSSANNYGIIGKMRDTGNPGVFYYYNQLYHEWSNSWSSTGINCPNDVWCRIVWRFDLDRMISVFNVKNLSTGSKYNHSKTWTVSPNPTTAPFRIGNFTNTNYCLDGKLDLIAVFNQFLSDSEADALLDDVFPPPPAIIANATGVYVVYSPPGQVQVNTAGVYVVYSPPGQVQVNAAGLIVVYSDTLAITAAGGLDIAGAGEAGFRDGKLQVTASGGMEASGQGESTFYDPTLRITATGGVETSGQGQVSFFAPGKLQVTASGGVDISGSAQIGFRDGKLQITASGGIEVTGSLLERLFNPTLQVTASGGLALGGAGEYSRSRTDPTDLHVTASGGLEVNGNGVFVPRLPGRQEVTAQGGMRIGGAGIAAFVRPEAPATKTVTAQGGVRVGGQGTIKLVKAEDVPSLIRAVTAQGGVQAAGGGQPNLRKPGRLDITAQGGVKVGQFRYPAGQLLQPGDMEPLSQAWSGRTALRIAGEGVVSFFTPSGLVVESAGARLVIGGTSAVGFISPPQLDIEAAGGVVLDEGAEALDVFETWAFTGANFEPSIYSGFNFNSYCEYRGRYYGAGRDGIYLLEGEDDDGKEIHTGVRIGPVNFGTNVLKRIRAIHPGDCGDRTEARIAAEAGKESYAGLEQGRLAGERFLGREFVVDIADFDRLGELEFTVLAQVKR